MASAMCCYSCRAFEDVSWPTHLRAVAHTTTPHRGDSPPFCPLRCASYLPFVVSLSPRFLFPLRHLSVPCLLIRSARRAAPSAFDIRPLHSPFKASRKKKKKKEMQAHLSQCRLGSLRWYAERRQDDGAIRPACKSTTAYTPCRHCSGTADTDAGKICYQSTGY